MSQNLHEGILLVSKKEGSTSFQIVHELRKRTHLKKVGHAGTLDPFATGVMVMLLGKAFTQKASLLIEKRKSYLATIHLGVETTTYDLDGEVSFRSEKVPSLEEIQKVLSQFQGQILQTPPMYSAKKVKGKKLYELARKGIHIEREPVLVDLNISLLSYEYPKLCLEIDCSKGTYIRSLAHDVGEALGTYGHLCALVRTKVGNYTLKECIDQKEISNSDFPLETYIRRHL